MNREIVLPVRKSWLHSLFQEEVVPPRRVVESWENLLRNPNIPRRLRVKLSGGIGRLYEMGLYDKNSGFHGGRIDDLESKIARKPNFGETYTLLNRRSDITLGEYWQRVYGLNSENGEKHG